MTLQAERRSFSFSAARVVAPLFSSRRRKSLSGKEEAAGLPVYTSARSKKSSRREFLLRCKRFRSLFRAAAHRLSKGTTWIYFDNRDTPRETYNSVLFDEIDKAIVLEVR